MSFREMRSVRTLVCGCECRKQADEEQQCDTHREGGGVAGCVASGASRVVLRWDFADFEAK